MLAYRLVVFFVTNFGKYNRSWRKSVTGRVYTVYCNISREKRESVYFYYIFSILYTVSEKSYSILYSVYCILLVYYLYTVSSILYTVSSILYCIL